MADRARDIEQRLADEAREYFTSRWGTSEWEPLKARLREWKARNEMARFFLFEMLQFEREHTAVSA